MGKWRYSSTIVDLGTRRQYSHRRENLKPYIVLHHQLPAAKDAALKTASLSLLNLNSTKINLFSVVFQSYYKQNSDDYITFLSAESYCLYETPV
jgi:hypothetical protein